MLDTHSVPRALRIAQGGRGRGCASVCVVKGRRGREVVVGWWWWWWVFSCARVFVRVLYVCAESRSLRAGQSVWKTSVKGQQIFETANEYCQVEMHRTSRTELTRAGLCR